MMMMIIIIIIISGFGIYCAAVVRDSGVGNTWQRLTHVLHEFLDDQLWCTKIRAVLTGRSTVSGFDLAWFSSLVFRAPLCLRSSWCYIYLIFFAYVLLVS